MKALYVWLLVGWKTLTGNIPVEKLEALLESDAINSDEVIAVYPDWVESHLTPNLETGKSTGVKEFQLKYHFKQDAGEQIDGHAIYAWLIERNQLPLCVELADLQWWAQHSNEIPKEFTGKFVYAWGSAVLSGGGYRSVPYLGCYGGKPYVLWCNLGYDWGVDGPACLRAS
jgi:hypothetical protein